MVGHLKRVTLGVTVLLLCVGLWCGCTDYGNASSTAIGSESESAMESSSESETVSSDTPTEAATDRQGYYNEPEDGVSKRY